MVGSNPDIEMAYYRSKNLLSKAKASQPSKPVNPAHVISTLIYSSLSSLKKTFYFLIFRACLNRGGYPR